MQVKIIFEDFTMLQCLNGSLPAVIFEGYKSQLTFILMWALKIHEREKSPINFFGLKQKIGLKVFNINGS